MKGAPRGIVGAAVLSAIVAAALIFIAVAVLRPALLAATYSSIVTEEHRAACEVQPAAWGWSSGAVSFYAYDRRGQSSNPNAPSLEVDLLARLNQSEEVAHRVTAGRLVILIPAAVRGPCAILRITTRDIMGNAALWLLPVLAVSVFASIVLAAIYSFAFVLRPLLQRVDALASSARGVGSSEFRPEPVSQDALGTIAAVLTQSHERVIANRDLLLERNRALEDHLAGIAHDLRTPLASMYLTLEALAKDAESPREAEARRAIADVVYLSSLVENLHQATRLRREVEVTSGKVDLADLVRRLEKRFSIIGRHAKVELGADVPDEGVWATCVPALAERAISNVIQNAIEHNEEGGHAAITLVRDASRFELTVSDDGPGLPDGSLTSLDEATFFAEGPRTRGPELGMLITAEIARRAAWDLDYEALSPSGLRVRFTGDLAPEPS